MEFRHLETFIAVAEELHFGHAAVRLNMTQPSVSQQIRALERELDIKLLLRNTRTVSLTEAGQAFLGPAYDALEAADLARRAAHVAPSTVLGNVSIGFAGSCAAKGVARLARAVRDRLPGVKLELKGQVYSGEAAAQVSRGQLDIGFSRLPITERGATHRVYEYEQVLLAMPEGHPLASADSVHLDDLADEGFIAYPSSGGVRIRQALDRAAESVGFYPRVIQEAPDSHTIVSLVAAGVGVSITEASIQDIHVPGVVYRPVTPLIPHIPAVLAWSDASASRATRAVLAVAEEVLPTPQEPGALG